MRRIFRPDDVRPAGCVFTIPARARHLRDSKPSRPFLLLTRSAGFELASLALMTTKSTEAGYGATLHEFADQRGKQSFPGQEHSYVDLSSLLFRRTDLLGSSEKTHSRHMDAVRAALKSSLGIGEGVGPGRAGTSIRGHLVSLVPAIAEMYEFGFGIVVTAHDYSASRRLQALVPVVDVRTFLADAETAADFQPEPGDVLPSIRERWMDHLPASWELPVVDTVRLSSFSERWEASPRRDTWLKEQIDRVYPNHVDADTLARIETALISRFSLPP